MTIATTLLVAALTVVPSTARARYLMGTVCEVAVDAKNAEAQIEAAFAEAKRVESMLSTWTGDSELARLNRGEGEASPELRALLARTLEWSRRTNRAFDPRMLALIRPERGEGFEEGAFGKGYAIDRMLARIDAPRVVINFGGQLGVRGSTEATIADPNDRDKPVVALTITNASLSTSANSERSHILDPRPGKLLPPRGSASVIAPDALTADILSTALFVMGEDEGLRWADANGVSAIFINPVNQIRLSAAARRTRVRAIDRKFVMKD
jgi:FAD:protein FMN transferase